MSVIACESGREEPLSTRTHSTHVYFIHRGGACVWLCGKSVNGPPFSHRVTTLVRLVLSGSPFTSRVKRSKVSWFLMGRHSLSLAARCAPFLNLGASCNGPMSYEFDLVRRSSTTTFFYIMSAIRSEAALDALCDLRKGGYFR